METGSVQARNLTEAHFAVTYVKSVMVIGASTSPKDIGKGLLASATFGISRFAEHPGLRAAITPPVGAYEANLVRFVIENQIRKKMNGDEREIEVMANVAWMTGAGNCSNQAALAYIRLRDRGIRPLDFTDFADFDHAFVLIGRLPEGTPPSASKSSQPDTWGEDCVICDPLMKEWYPAAEFNWHWPGKTPRSNWRLD